MGMTNLLVVAILEEMAPILRVVDTGAASTIAAQAAKILVAVHIASGGGSTHASSSSSDVIGTLQNHKQVTTPSQLSALVLLAVASDLWW